MNIDSLVEIIFAGFCIVVIFMILVSIWTYVIKLMQEKSRYNVGDVVLYRQPPETWSIEDSIIRYGVIKEIELKQIKRKFDTTSPTFIYNIIENTKLCEIPDNRKTEKVKECYILKKLDS